MVLASRNRGKAREFERLLGDTFTVRPLPAAVVLPQEVGQTFAENARLKAEAVWNALGGRQAVLADDSGLEVASLGGRPGVHSARFAGETAGDEENVAKLLDELVGMSNREARFVCALCLLLPNDQDNGSKTFQRIEVEGYCEGTITVLPRGAHGFGYDPVFRPAGWEATLAEADPQTKDLVSHRGAAARALLAHLASEDTTEGAVAS